MRETVTSPPTLGAGRRYSYNLPNPSAFLTVNTFQNSDQVQARPGSIAASSQWNFIDTGAPPAPRGGVIYNGRVALALTSNTTPTGTQWSPNFGGTNRPYTMPFTTARQAAGSPQGIDDAWCWSFSAILAFDAMPGAVTGDVGIAIGVANRTAIRSPTQQLAGMELGPTGVGTIGVVIRQADTVAVTLAQNIAGVADMTQYHRYEIRLLGPTPFGEASVKFMIDGNPQLTLSYGAGTVLPDQKIVGSFLGFTPGLVNLAASAAGTVRMYVVPNSVVVCCAPEEAALP